MHRLLSFPLTKCGNSQRSCLPGSWNYFNSEWVHWCLTCFDFHKPNLLQEFRNCCTLTKQLKTSITFLFFRVLHFIEGLQKSFSQKDQSPCHQILLSLLPLSPPQLEQHPTVWADPPGPTLARLICKGLWPERFNIYTSRCNEGIDLVLCHYHLMFAG